MRRGGIKCGKAANLRRRKSASCRRPVVSKPKFDRERAEASLQEQLDRKTQELNEALEQQTVEAIRTLLGVPILKGDDLLGVMTIYHQRGSPFVVEIAVPDGVYRHHREQQCLASQWRGQIAQPPVSTYWRERVQPPTCRRFENRRDFPLAVCRRSADFDKREFEAAVTNQFDSLASFRRASSKSAAQLRPRQRIVTEKLR
jgi:hypothetical protein